MMYKNYESVVIPIMDFVTLLLFAAQSEKKIIIFIFTLQHFFVFLQQEFYTVYTCTYILLLYM